MCAKRSSSVRGVVGLDHGASDASAIAELMAVLACPLADPRGPLRVTISSAPRASGASSANAPPVQDPGLELLAQLLSVTVVQIDFVGHTVQAE